MYFLKRSPNKHFEIKKIESNIKKKIKILQAIVGVQYFDTSILEEFKHSKLIEKQLIISCSLNWIFLILLNMKSSAKNYIK